METAISKLPLPPVPREHWLFKSSYYLATDTFPFLFESQRTMPGIYHLTSIYKKVIVVDKPEYVKHVLQDNNKNYTKSFAYKVLARLLGQGLLTSEGDFWRKQRRLAQPAFHRERLANLTDVMVNCTDELITDIQSEAGRQVNLAKYMMSVTLDIVAKAMFGSDVSGLVNKVGVNIDYANERAVERIRNPFKLPPWIPTPENRREQKAISALNEVVMGIIEGRRKSKEKHDDLLQMLMEAEDIDTGERMSDQQLRDECMTIFLAGHETTALALSWFWYLMAKNPAVRAKFYKEVDEVLQGRKPTIADLQNLSYTRQAIDEALRLYPPAWIIGRMAIEDDEIGGYRVPAEYNVLIPVYAIHRNPEIWEDPDTFKPERFAKENMKEKHKYAYFPFGGGPRFCIGNNFALMEMQVVVAMLAQKFAFELPPNYEADTDQLITLRPQGGMPMHVKER